MQRRLLFDAPRREIPYVSGATNAPVEAALREWLAAETGHAGLRLLTAPRGAGKTRLLKEIARDHDAAFVTGARLPNPLPVAERAILVDDAHLANSFALLGLIDRMRSWGLPLLLAGEGRLSGWPSVREAPADLPSRLSAAVTTELPPPDEALMADVLEAAFRALDLTMPREVIEAAVPNLVRRLGAVVDVAAHAVEIDPVGKTSRAFLAAAIDAAPGARRL